MRWAAAVPAARYNAGMRIKGWFGPKTFGWGVSPASWQGWLVTALFILAAIAAFRVPTIQWGWPGWSRQAIYAGDLILFLLVVWLTYADE